MKNKYIVIFLVAILIRLILAVFFINIFPEWPTGSSKSFRIELAESIASGKGFTYENTPNLYQTPVYPFFLAIVFITLGNHWWAIAFFQGILEGFSCVGISKIGNKFSKDGWTAGIIYAFYPYAIMQSRSIVDTPIFVLLFIMTIYFFLDFIEKQRLSKIFIASIFLGLGILNRPSIIVIIPAFVIFMIVKKLNWLLILRNTVIFIVIAGLIPFTWILRNHHLTGAFPILTVGGNHFMWFGHNEHIYEVLKKGESPDIIGRDLRYPMNPNIKVSDFFKISPREQVELSRKCSEIANNWIANNKSEVFRYTLFKLKRFLIWEYGIKNQDAPLQNLRVLAYRITNAPITILGWLGLFLLLIKKKEIGIFIGISTIGFIFIHVISLFGNRHKIPLDALFMAMIPLSISFLYSKILLLRKFIDKA